MDILQQLKDALNEASKLTDKYDTYRDNYVGFAKDILRIKVLTEDQEEILTLLQQPKARIAVPSANGVGKTFIAATAALTFLYTHNNDTVVVTTAPTDRQVKELLWRELNKQHAEAHLPGRCLTKQLTLDSKWYAFGFSSDRPQQFQGFHATNVLLVVDEANGFNEELRDALESCVIGDHAAILLIGNPLKPEGWFHEMCDSESSWDVVQIDAYNHPNIVQDKTVIPGAITKEKVIEFAETYGEESPVYLSRVRGQFPEADASSTYIATRRTVEESINRELPELDTDFCVRLLSVDSARLGEDYTVLLGVDVRVPMILKDNATDHATFNVFRHDRYQQMDVAQIAITIKQLNIQDQYSMVIIDEVGSGGGIIDILKWSKFPPLVVPFNGQRIAQHTDVFANMRAEGYVALKKAFSDRRICLDNHRAWGDQISRLHYDFTMQGSGKIRMVGKRYDDIQKRVFSSPDDSDALMQAVWAVNVHPNILKHYKIRNTKLSYAVIRHDLGIAS